MNHGIVVFHLTVFLLVACCHMPHGFWCSVF